MFHTSLQYDKVENDLKQIQVPHAATITSLKQAAKAGGRTCILTVHWFPETSKRAIDELAETVALSLAITMAATLSLSPALAVAAALSFSPAIATPHFQRNSS